jgi:excisionase family DNA binding protein
MNPQSRHPFDPFFDEIRRIVRDEIKAVSHGNEHQALLTPEELAQQLSVPVSWVYEQSRQGNIPVHRIGKYIRFSLPEVLDSQAKRTP